MPSIVLNKKVFEALIGKKIPEKELKDKISMLGTDLDSVTADEIDVEIFPNRPDLLSEQGFSRAMGTFMGLKKGIRSYDVADSKEKVIICQSVKNIRPYTACAIVKGLKLNDEKIKEIIQIQEKLHISFCRNRKKAAIGIYPFDMIKPPIRYLAIKPKDIKFQPLESKKELNGQQILCQHPAGREYGHLLEGLDKYPVFIDDDDEILSMPPIINSHRTGKITEKTTEVFIECSGLNLKTQNELLNILVTCLADMGGKLYSMNIYYPDKKIRTPNLDPRKVKFDIAYTNKILGMNFKEQEIKKLFDKMGFEYCSGEVSIPAYRSDILHQVDLAEEIAIAYGYDNFTSQPTKISTIGYENPFEKFKNKIANLLTGLGYIETNTYHLTSKKNQKDKMETDIPVIELENALTSDYSVLRAWIIPVLLQVLAENKHNEYPQKIFDHGTIFKKGKTETGVEESTRLAILSCHGKSDFTEIKQVLDYLFKMLDLKYSINPVKHGSFIKGRAGRVYVNNKKVAYIGELNPQVLYNWQLEMPVAALEINLADLFELIK